MNDYQRERERESEIAFCWTKYPKITNF
jgi:hypothetical protein